MIFVQADYYWDTTHSIVEVKALLLDLELCRTKGINEMDIEANSMMLV